MYLLVSLLNSFMQIAAEFSCLLFLMLLPLLQRLFVQLAYFTSQIELLIYFNLRF